MNGRRAPTRVDASLLRLIVPVSAAGALCVVAAAVNLAADATFAALVGLVALLAASLFQEAFPVAVGRSKDGYVSLAAVFIVGSAVLYGWEAAALLGFATRATLEIVQRRPLSRLAYNSSVYAVAGACAGLAAQFPSLAQPQLQIVATVAIAATASWVVNVLLVAAVIARASNGRPTPVLVHCAAITVIPYAMMASATVLLAVTWHASPFLTPILLGPLLAVALYQRSAHRELEAMRLALTDPVTGLGNHRQFHERLEEAYAEAKAQGTPLTVCLLDLDDFKTINDTHGHPAGDRVLAAVAAALGTTGERFRIGGDEFALLLPTDRLGGLAAARAVVARVTAAELAHGGHVGVSAGIATYPVDARDRHRLIEAADEALYAAKRRGKARVCPASEMRELHSRRRVPLAAAG